MEQLISSTLDYVDGEGRPMTTERLDLGSLLQTLVDECHDRGADVALTSQQSMTIKGDLLRLRRLFTNLIENGLKFGRCVKVTYRPEGEDVVVDVVDDGDRKSVEWGKSVSVRVEPGGLCINKKKKKKKIK